MTMNHFLVDMRTLAMPDSTSNHLVVEMDGPADGHINQEMGLIRIQGVVGV